MRSTIVKAVLSSIILCSPAAAFPHPQAADNANSAGTSDSSSVGPAAANPFPDDSQSGVDPGDSLAATTTSRPPVATHANDPAGSAAGSAQNAGLVDGAVISTPLTPDTPSDDPPSQKQNSSVGKNETLLGHPGELTGTLLGMPNCSGIFYNPKWDSCDKATGKIKAKVEQNEKRQETIFKPQRFSALPRQRKSIRQVIDDSNNNAEHEHDPTILSGVAGIDDGATTRESNPPGRRRRHAPRDANNWNTPFGDTDNSGVSAANTGGGTTRKDQDKSPGNNNFWNTPFEDPQGQGQEQGGGRTKQRRQSSGNTDLRLQSGPLSGEDRDLDGAIPYMDVTSPKSKRDWDKKPHVEVGPPGPGGARNIIINKRQNQTAGSGSTTSSHKNNDPTGYLGAVSHSGNGLNYESPSTDQATPPKKPASAGKRAQPDFNYVRPAHTGTDAGNRGDIPKVVAFNRRQASSSSSNSQSESYTPGGYLGELGEAEVTAGKAGAVTVPSRP